MHPLTIISLVALAAGAAVLIRRSRHPAARPEVAEPPAFGRPRPPAATAAASVLPAPLRLPHPARFLPPVLPTPRPARAESDRGRGAVWPVPAPLGLADNSPAAAKRRR